MSIAHAQGLGYQLFGLIRIHLEYAEAKLRDGIAIIKGDVRYAHAPQTTCLLQRAERDEFIPRLPLVL